MQTHFERRTGTDRRGANRSAGTEWRWYETSLGTSAGGEYDPYDPYWEPVIGQDDD
ncbi:MAG: hypothetical protein H6R17_2465 [Proteobacteria bacterium]|nr:hypothetical protein [Pseudomonadota bacterium]